ncbi:hypothetical protein AVEN_184947-1 [Araneus ventricosus]|uniref:CCHC-type domain-containing protein n=1 Tax=Araneus ventricosus TaxID=182803 RepID=A0A4Y2WT50_ARAVE|nr:hypothetical protein AVEN_184947-1 [Araneus ventricosus]
MPATDDEESTNKGIDSSSTSVSSQKIPVVALSKVAGVGPIELLINDVIDFNFDPSVSENIIAVLQELVKIYISRGRDIKAGSRESIVEKVIAPFIKIFKERETTNLSTIYDLKASQLDVTERQYQSKIRTCEATIESLNGKLNILCSELNDYKKDFKESSRSLIETTKEVKSLVSRATPSFSSIVTRPSVTKLPVTTQRGNHVLLLRPKKESTSEDNRKRVETALVSRNSPIRINRISKVSRGGLIIEAPNKDELQALERELACVTTIDDHFDITRPKKRSPQIILIGVPRDVDKDRLCKGLSAKNIFLCDSSNKPLFELNFSMKTRFASNWAMTIDPAIYKRLFGESGLFFEFTRLRFDNFYGIKQCKHCCKFGHTTKWCPSAKQALCMKCGLDHSTEKCPKLFCINCSEHNLRQNTAFNIDHSPYDRNKCESFDKQKDNLVKHTDYGVSSGAPD